MKKTYCLDTNVLIHDPSAVFAFEDNCVVVTEYVLFELDDLKKKHTDPAVKQSAIDAAKFLLEISNGLSAKVVAQQKKRSRKGSQSIPGATPCRSFPSREPKGN